MVPHWALGASGYSVESYEISRMAASVLFLVKLSLWQSAYFSIQLHRRLRPRARDGASSG
jgi:hypothetical protein